MADPPLWSRLLLSQRLATAIAKRITLKVADALQMFARWWTRYWGVLEKEINQDYRFCEISYI
jgi:hypothetical protein